MGTCVSKQNYKENVRRHSDNPPIVNSDLNCTTKLVNSSSTPAVYNPGSNDGNINLDQIAAVFLTNTAVSSPNSTINNNNNNNNVRHSLPNTPKVSSNNLIVSNGGGLLNNSIATPSSTVTDEEDVTNTIQSFSNSSTPRIGTLPGQYPYQKSASTLNYNPSRISMSEFYPDSLTKKVRPLSIAENNSNNTNIGGVPSTYLTSVTGPDVHKPVMYSVSDAEMLVALFDYNARDEEEVSLRKSDNLRIIDESDDDWISVENINSNKKGYVPKIYVARKGSFEAEDWFFNSISRKDSERLLLLRGNIEGTFLIRGSETMENQFSLSVHHNGTVNHYRVRRRHLESADTNTTINRDEGYCITSRNVFRTLHTLVEFYSESANGLCCVLTRACPRPPPVTSDLTRRTRDRWEISRTSIKLLKKLGSGNFGEVFQGKWNGTTDVAIKTMKPGTMPKDEFLKEARIMKKLSHPNLVRLYAVCSDDPIYIVTELMSNGSLIEYLRGDEGRYTGLIELIDMMGQIANGMSYLEKEGYIHRDLAARNILIGDGNVCKVADFGLTRIVQGSGDIYTARQGTKFPIKWTAPEAALVGKFTVKSDVWSYGIVLYEIITHGQIPFPTMNNIQTLQQVECGYRMPRPHNCPSEIYTIMLNCWDMIPDKRPTFGALAEFFNDNNADDCCTKYRPTSNSIRH